MGSRMRMHLLCMVILVCYCHAAEEPERQETRQVVKEYYETGELWKEISMRGDKQDGTETWYRRNGTISHQSEWKEGKRHGRWVNYYGNGLVESEVEYHEGHPMGLHVEYYPNGAVMYSVRYDERGERIEGTAEGTLVTPRGAERYGGETYMATPFKNGVIHGVRYRFYCGREEEWSGQENARVASKEEYANGLRHGTAVHYHPITGELQYILQYCNGKLHGLHKEFYDNGKERHIQDYLCGTMHGEEIEYYETGQCKRKLKWMAGLRHGQEFEYYPNGQPKRKVTWKTGEKDGEETFYDEKGNMERVILWDMGQRVDEEPKPEKDDAAPPGGEAKPDENADKPKNAE